jgi:hypothetical protein
MNIFHEEEFEDPKGVIRIRISNTMAKRKKSTTRTPRILLRYA